MLELVSVPGCTAARFEAWDAPPGRSFAAYSTRGDFRWLLGHSVIDEFATLSSPIFLAPRALLGRVYDAGISLGHRRDPEMGIDQGWPPLCIGLDRPAPALSEGWEGELLAALTEHSSAPRVPPAGVELRRGRAAGWEVEVVRIGEATLIATAAPLLPRQLRELCAASEARCAAAVAGGNRLQRSEDPAPRTVAAISRVGLGELITQVRELSRP